MKANQVFRERCRDIMRRRRQLAELCHKLFDHLTVCSDCANVEDNPDLCSKARGCCTRCGKTKGYYSHAEKWFLHPEERFHPDPEYGYFDPAAKCCRIPRAYRSTTCLEYFCDTLATKLLPSLRRKLCDDSCRLINETSCLFGEDLRREQRRIAALQKQAKEMQCSRFV